MGNDADHQQQPKTDKLFLSTIMQINSKVKPAKYHPNKHPYDTNIMKI